MTDHYFSKKPSCVFRRESFIVRVNDIEIPLQSGSGIFSMKELDFGTKLLIEHAQIPKVSASILDLGCGYGIVGIALKKKFSEINVTMCDVNERAVKIAKENCSNNHVEAELYISDLYSHPQLHHKTFDVILTNPPFSAGKKLCIEFIKQSYSHVNKGGFFELVAPHNKGGESLKRVMLETFGNAGELAKKSGFRVYMSVKK